MCGWAPAALLPVFQILGTEYRKKVITTKFLDEAANMDAFTKIDFTYDDAVASIKVAKAAKSEGELIVTGTKGYIYVPAPWWKTDYFEVRYENPEDNQRFFYQLDGEGIRYEIVAWIEDFKSYQNLTSLNRRVLVELVESITVYDKEHIHIQYRFDQEIRNVLEYCSSVPAAETEESAV